MSYRQLPLHYHQIPASPIVLGCMRFGGAWDGQPITNDLVVEGRQAVETALEIGIHHFDLADIYTRGKAEHVFGRVLSEIGGCVNRLLFNRNVASDWPGRMKVLSATIRQKHIF